MWKQHTNTNFVHVLRKILQHAWLLMINVQRKGRIKLLVHLCGSLFGHTDWNHIYVKHTMCKNVTIYDILLHHCIVALVAFCRVVSGDGGFHLSFILNLPFVSYCMEKSKLWMPSLSIQSMLLIVMRSQDGQINQSDWITLWVGTDFRGEILFINWQKTPSLFLFRSIN